MMAWTPQLPSTTWVTPKSTPTERSEIASSSLSPREAVDDRGADWGILRAWRGTPLSI